MKKIKHMTISEEVIDRAEPILKANGQKFSSLVEVLLVKYLDQLERGSS